MPNRLSDAIIEQHRTILHLLDDAVERHDDTTARRAFAAALVAHADLEEEIVYRHARSLHRDSAVEEHAVLRFAAIRFVRAETKRIVVTRARVVRDMMIHHVEREERTTLPAIERSIGARASSALALSVRRRFAGR